MRTPKDEPEAYKGGDLRTYIEGFPDEPNRLFLFHGLTDENVHFTNTHALIAELIKHGKPYQLQLYPVNRHATLQYIWRATNSNHFRCERLEIDRVLPCSTRSISNLSTQPEIEQKKVCRARWMHHWGTLDFAAPQRAIVTPDVPASIKPG
eukprot:gene23708-9895_t